jgi:GAF domain-containing protein
MVVPFEYNEEVIGVVEIGKLETFLPEEQKFLAMVASSIAIACQSAKARVRMAELLSQIQDNFMTE